VVVMLERSPPHLFLYLPYFKEIETKETETSNGSTGLNTGKPKKKLLLLSLLLFKFFYFYYFFMMVIFILLFLYYYQKLVHPTFIKTQARLG
jgi:hypothetical protein